MAKNIAESGLSNFWMTVLGGVVTLFLTSLVGFVAWSTVNIVTIKTEVDEMKPQVQDTRDDIKFVRRVIEDGQQRQQQAPH